MTPPTRNRPTRRFSRCRFRVRTFRESCHQNSTPRTGHRFYTSDAGRWLNRDPIGEQGGPNEYGFVNNTPIFYVDLLGLSGGTGGGFVWPTVTPPSMPYYPPPPPPPAPDPGDTGTNPKHLFPYPYICSSCTKKSDRVTGIPGATTLPNPPSNQGPPGGGHQTYPVQKPGSYGGAGGGTCSILVVQCPGFVSVFHFTYGDNPAATLGNYTFPSGCNAVMCGGNPDKESNCLADGTKSAAAAAGLNLVGISANSACGGSYDADGNWTWWQWGAPNP